MDSDTLTALALCKKTMNEKLSEIIFSEKKSINAITAYHCILALSQGKEIESSESILKMFFEGQRADGCIPSFFVSGKKRYGVVPGIDKIEGNLFLLPALNEYTKLSENKDFIIEKWDNINKAFNYLLQYLDKDFLLKAPLFSGYIFPFLRHRKSLFLNALFCVSAKAYSELCETFSDYSEKHMAFNFYWSNRKALNRFFWKKTFYSATSEQNIERIALPGNLLIIANELAMEEKEKIVVDYLSEKLGFKDFGKTFVPEFKAVFLYSFLKKVQAISGKAFFPWIACMAAIALKKTGKTEKAKEILSFTGKILNNDCPEWVILETGEMENQNSILSASAYVNAVKSVFKKN